MFFSLGALTLPAASSDPDFFSVLDFGAKGEGTCTFILEESPDRKQTTVRWQFAMSFGDNTGRRYFGLVFKNAIRRDLAEGLGQLETAVLTPAPKP